MKVMVSYCGITGRGYSGPYNGAYGEVIIE